MAESRSALLVANWVYEDADLRQLVAPGNDAESLAAVLRDPKLCGFEVTTLLNRPSREACEAIERFFLNRRRDDLLLLYFSCHGIKDDDGQLYFAAPDTRMIDRSRPMRSTALGADFVRAVMRGSSSRRQVLMLDCCYSGAFASAMMGKGDKSVGVKDHFEQGRGLVVMTASDAIQYSFEGDKVEGEATRSIFTRTLVKGIETGEADLDRDGTISLDELYDYVYEHVVEANPSQRPRKWTLEVEGKIIVAQSPVVRAAELPADLVAAIHSPLSRIRLGAVEELAELLRGSHKGLALAACGALEKLAGDDSRQVSAAALAALERESAETAQAVPPSASAKVPPPIAEPSAPSVPPKVKLAPVAAPKVAAAPESVPVEPPPKRVEAEARPVAPILAAPAPAPAALEPEKPARDIWNEELPKKLQLWRSPLTWAGLLVLVLTGVFVYRGFNHGKQQNQSSESKQHTDADQKKASQVLAPIALERPPFDYTLNEARGEDAKIKLVQSSQSPNKILDEDNWLKSNDLSIPRLTVPNDFQHEKGNIPSQIPAKQGDDLLIKAIKQENYLLCIYGPNFASGRYLTIFDLRTMKPKFAFDFMQYASPPSFVKEDQELVYEAVNWAVLKDDIVYVSNAHSTYAKSSQNKNAYITALDAKAGKLLWRSQPLVSNSMDFLLFEGAIITGYGFTNEQHNLYVLNQSDGKVVQTLPLRKMASWILRKGDDIYVRTYDTDYVFRATALTPERPGVGLTDFLR